MNESAKIGQFTIPEAGRKNWDSITRQTDVTMVELNPEHVDTHIAEAKLQHPEENQAQITGRALARAWCQENRKPRSAAASRPADRTEILKGPSEQPPVNVINFLPERWERMSLWAWRLLMLLALLFLCAKPAHCQLDGLAVQNSGGTTIKQWAGGIAKLKCNANLNCTFASGVLTIDAGAGGSVAWSGIAAPTVGLNLAHAAWTTTFTWNATTGAGVSLFRGTDTASNTGTGYLFDWGTAASSALKPFRICYRGTTDCITYDTTNLGAVGAATLTANALASNSIAALTNFLGTLCGTNQILEDQGASWVCIATPSGSAHNLLSATHSDTLAASVVLGDIPHGNVTPAWARLAGNITTTKKFLAQTGNATISAAPVWDTIIEADVPTLSAAKISGTAVVQSFTLTGGAGIAAIGDFTTNRTVATASGETDFLASGALTCTTAQQGRIQVHTTALQYCDNAATPALQYAAYADSAGAALTGDTATSFFATGTLEDTRLSANVSLLGSSIGLTTEVSGILPGANGGTNNGFMDFTGPATSLKTFTLPNASTTILTTNAAVTIAEGGTGTGGTLTGLVRGSASAYTAAELSGDATTSGSNVVTLATKHRTFVRSIVIFLPTTADTNLAQIYFGQAVTLTRIACSTNVGTVDIQLDKRAEATPNTAGTNALTATLQCTTTTGASTTFTSAGVALRIPLNLQILATATTPGVVRIHLEGTVD